MYSIVNHLKKNESLINRQLCIIDSNSKNENESTSSFSNKLLKTEKRVCKIDMIDANVSNTLYNIDNNSVLLDIDEGLLNGEIVNKKIIVDDTEIKNNEIFSTNKINGDVNLYNYITSANSTITDIKTQGLFIVNTGLFTNTLINFYNTDNFSPIKTVDGFGVNGNSGFCACYNIDQSFKWVMRLEATNIKEIKVEVDESYIYVYGVSTEISMYDIDGTKHTTDFNTSINGIFVFKCTYDGYVELVITIPVVNIFGTVFLSVSDCLYLLYSITQSVWFRYNLIIYNKLGAFIDNELIISTQTDNNMSITTIKTDNTQIFISVDFTGAITYTDGSSNTSNGDLNINIIEYNLIYDDTIILDPNEIIDTNSTLEFIGSVKIGGSNTDNACIVQALNDKLYISGRFTSNPVVFYKSDKTQEFVLDNPLISNTNIFMCVYPIDFIKNNKNSDLCFYITSPNDIIPTDLKCKNNIFLSCIFQKTIKFYDVNGYVSASDVNIITDSDDFSQCILSYSLDGLFKSRIYNTKAGQRNAIDINSSKLFTFSNFTQNNDFYNTKSELSITLNTKDTYNSVIISFFNSDVGITVDYEKLDKTLVCTQLVEDEISLLLNINSFAELLGFEKSQKFLATSIGNAISWDTIIINSNNSTLTLELQIANLTTLKFDDYIINFVIPPETYNQYNLIYTLNQIFSTFTYLFLNQTVPAFYYNTVKKVFYIRLDIQGSFKVTNTNLSNTMNLILTTSPMCVISDIHVSNLDNIIDNTKLTLKLTDNTNTEVVNSVNFSEAFPLVHSNNLTVITSTESNIYAVTSTIADEVSNINIGDKISFEYQYINKILFTAVNSKLSVSGSGQYMIRYYPSIQLTNNYGNTWVGIDYFSNILVVDADMSDNGKYIYVVDRNNIFVSDDYGITFSIRDSVRDWLLISAASATGYVVAVTETDGLFISSDNGYIWKKNIDIGINYPSNLSLSQTGQYQLISNYLSVFTSADFGNTWAHIFYSPTNVLSISGDGKYMIAISNAADIQYSDNYGAIGSWNPVISPDPLANDWQDSCISKNGEIQIIIDTLYVLYSNDYGITRTLYVMDTNLNNFSNNVIRIAPESYDTLNYNVVMLCGYVDKPKTVLISVSNGIENSWVLNDTSEQRTLIQGESLSYSGKYIAYVDVTVSISSDYGKTFTNYIFSNDPAIISGITMSSDGKYMTIIGRADISGVFGARIWVSSNYGVDWLLQYESFASAFPIKPAAMSSDGKYQFTDITSNILSSSNYGVDWVELVGPGTNISTCIIEQDTDAYIISTLEDIHKSTDYGNTWVINNTPDIVGFILDFAVSSDSTYRTLTYSNNGVYTSNDSGVTWVLNTYMSSLNGLYIDMDATGKFQICSNKLFIYKSDNYGIGEWIPNNYTIDGRRISISNDGTVSAVFSTDDMYINLFLFERPELNVIYVDNTDNSIKRIIFAENIITHPPLIKLNGFNLDYGLNFTISSILNSPVENLYITPGDYNIDGFITQVNKQIHDINPNFYYSATGSQIEPFIFNQSTKKITFNPYYIGAKSDVLVITNLLQLMGFINLPNFITSPITGEDVVDSNIIGINRSNIYIKSNSINNFMVENTTSNNMKLNKVLATLGYSSEHASYKLINMDKNEIFLSQKADISEIDIQIIDNNGEIVNLNGGSVTIAMNFIKA